MARIRTIKPEFPHSESIGKLSRDARLLFVQLWTIADDHGRARAAPRLLAGQLYPYDDDVPKLISKWLDELEQNGFVRRYEIEASQYLDIPGWGKHQRIDNAGKSNIPEFRGDSPRTAASDGEPPLYLGPRKGPRTNIRAVADATRPNEFFDQFWKGYPKRAGSNPKTPARKKFFALVKSGILPEGIIRAAGRYKSECAENKQIGTPYVAQAITWLNQERFGDYAPNAEAATGPPQPPRGDMPSDDELRAKYGAKNGRSDGVSAETSSEHGRVVGDRSGEFLGAGQGDDQSDVPRECADNRARHTGIRSLGDVLSQSSALATVGFTRAGSG